MCEKRVRRVFRAVVGLSVCLSALVAVHAVEVLDGPTLTMDPNERTPLAGVVELTTDVPVKAELTLTFEGEARTVFFPVPTAQHYLPVLGLRPDRTYTVDVNLIPGGPLTTMFATTGPLHEDFPTLVVNASTPAEMEPGYTLIDCLRRSGGDTRPRFGAIVDEAGEVVWYTTACFQAGVQLPNGNFLYRRGTEAVEMDLLGNEQVVPLDDPGIRMHHDFQRTPHGTFLSLTTQSVEVENYPTSDTDPDAPTQTVIVRDEPVVEFLPDGSLRREWPLVDIMDETRIAYDSLNSSPQGLDWIHTNAVTYNPADDSIIVSARHQDCVFKFARATGELIWILGNHNNWPVEFQPYLLTPVGTPFSWQFHQHAPMWTGSGSLLLFDNGNWRASPFDGTTPVESNENFSRGVEFEIDEQNMEVTQLWEFGQNTPERLYSFFISDADWQPITGNRLMTFGGINFVDGEPSADLGMGASHTRVIETTDDPVATVVLDLALFDAAEGGSISVYRSERISSLYPQNYFKAPDGVGSSLRARLDSGGHELFWSPAFAATPESRATYFIVYVSTSPDAGFTILDSTAFTELSLDAGPDSILYYKVVAANLAGTSGDEPDP